MSNSDSPKPSKEQLDACVEFLSAVVADRSVLARFDEEDCKRLLAAAGQTAFPSRTDRRRLGKVHRKKARKDQKAHDLSLMRKTQMRSAQPIVTPAQRLKFLPAPTERPTEMLEEPRACYVCKEMYRELHFFYSSMCPTCADLNYAKRSQTAPLDGKVALVTGARIKIGFETVLILLRAGARVIATTRFPTDAANRFASQPDYESWRDRLQVYGLDLRHIPSVENFGAHLDQTLDRLDILINNAAQTVRRPAQFYTHLVEGELRSLPDHAQPLLRDHGQLSQSALVARPLRISEMSLWDEQAFPKGEFDEHGQQLDCRPTNSWRMQLGDVPTVELVEVHLVNAIAPFVLTSRLKPLMERNGNGEQHVINVSAMEASFSRNKKTDKHPHTNMAKASLNMMTRTSAADFAESRIFMNSVDTGWITDERPHTTRMRLADEGFHAPLDLSDGAARVYDPIVRGEAGEDIHGVFLKDYAPAVW